MAKTIQDTKARNCRVLATLRDMDIDISSVDNFEEFLDPFLDEYFTEIKLDIRELYLDKFTEEELAYYDFISKESGLSFLAKQIEISSDVLEIRKELRIRIFTLRCIEPTHQRLQNV